MSNAIDKNCKKLQTALCKNRENCRVEVAESINSPRKMCLRRVILFFYLLQFEKNAVFMTREINLLKPLSKITQSIE